MRSVFAYTSARILMFGCSVILLYVAGARGVLLLGLGLVISALASYILLNKQRQILAGKLNGRLGQVGSKATAKAAEFRERLEEGTAAEDDEQDEPVADTDLEADPVLEADTDLEADPVLEAGTDLEAGAVPGAGEVPAAQDQPVR